MTQSLTRSVLRAEQARACSVMFEVVGSPDALRLQEVYPQARVWPVARLGDAIVELPLAADPEALEAAREALAALGLEVLAVRRSRIR
ncbi:hypothetical protein HNR42_000906 [Deinobacterium chartae]|uniref:Uncharacterized protein n=1 Tax=Deinobacterium chartae TaxID=521158 RepID=A0A841HZ49_9DEIO|nr:hypothetical protein [Deinobacterium chartae]MBB6097489.1 hypothetical protein [Deinobacterium chartae]